MPTPLPTLRDLAAMPWWAVLSGLVGAVQVYASLTQIQKVGAGSFMGLTVSAALITSLVIDHFGWFRLQVHPINGFRALGAALLFGGIGCRGLTYLRENQRQPYLLLRAWQTRIRYSNQGNQR